MVSVYIIVNIVSLFDAALTKKTAPQRHHDGGAEKHFLIMPMKKPRGRSRLQQKYGCQSQMAQLI